MHLNRWCLSTYSPSNALCPHGHTLVFPGIGRENQQQQKIKRERKHEKKQKKKQYSSVFHHEKCQNNGGKKQDNEKGWGQWIIQFTYKKILYLTLMNQIISLLESLVKNIYRHATKARRVRLGERSRQWERSKQMTTLMKSWSKLQR